MAPTSVFAVMLRREACKCDCRLPDELEVSLEDIFTDHAAAVVRMRALDAQSRRNYAWIEERILQAPSTT